MILSGSRAEKLPKHKTEVDWEVIDTVLLDMDGTLLDLHFDNFFWQQHLPRAYARHHALPEDEAFARLQQKFDAVHGTLDWYCLDYWTRELGLDVVMLKRQLQHLIALRPGARDFLLFLRESGKQVVLVTNAHRASLSLKMELTGIAGSFSRLVSTHDYGCPKEDQAFWQRLAREIDFDCARTLFVDDTPRILAAAQDFGIAHLWAVREPDSQSGPRPPCGHPQLVSFCPLVLDRPQP